MECDQRVIVQFHSNGEIDTYEITQRLQVQFREHVSALRTVRFWIAEVGIDRQDLRDEIRTERSPLDDLDAKIPAI
jgi:hypothetical protein